MLDDISGSNVTVRARYFFYPNHTIQASIRYPMYIGRLINEIIRAQQAVIQINDRRFENKN